MIVNNNVRQQRRIYDSLREPKPVVPLREHSPCKFLCWHSLYSLDCIHCSLAFDRDLEDNELEDQTWTIAVEPKLKPWDGMLEYIEFVMTECIRDSNAFDAWQRLNSLEAEVVAKERAKQDLSAARAQAFEAPLWESTETARPNLYDELKAVGELDGMVDPNEEYAFAYEDDAETAVSSETTFCDSESQSSAFNKMLVLPLDPLPES